MGRLRGFGRRFRFPWRSIGRIRRDVDDEIAFHLTEKVDALQREGLPLNEARQRALVEFGDLDVARRRLVNDDRQGERLVRWRRVIEEIARDARYAWRSLRRSPGFSVVAILVLGLGIGVVSGAFSLVYVLTLEGASMREPEAVLGVFAEHPERGSGRFFSYPEYEQIRERVEGFSSLAAHQVIDTGIEERGVTRRIMAAFTSANYFETFGVPLAQGRGFTAAEERGEEPAVAVVSHDYWVRNGADPDLLGSVVRVAGQPLVVVGIAARGFTGTMALIQIDVWLPLAAMERISPSGVLYRLSGLLDLNNRSLLLFGRLRDGTTPAEAGAELASLATRVEANAPAEDGTRYMYIVGELGRTSIGTRPSPPDAGLSSDVVLPLAMSSVVLLIACLNLANMLLARGAGRRTEIAIRQSLGSGRVRLVRQLLTEGLLLAVLGGIVGLISSYWVASRIARAAAQAVPLDMTILLDTRPDWRTLLVTALTCVVATFLFGLGPAWRVTGANVLGGLKERAGTVSSRGRRIRRVLSGTNLLMVGQIALSLAMLTAGGLFMRSALFAAAATPSFSLERTLLVDLDMSLIGYDETRSRAAYEEILRRLRSLPGVENAGMASLVPLSGITSGRSVQPAGLAPGESVASGYYSVITDGYFDALSVPILRGRDFTPAEATSDAGPRVAIIDEPLARRLFPDGGGLGRSIQFNPGPDNDPIPMEVVGIAGGTPGDGFAPTPAPHVYLPYGQAYTTNMQVLLGISEQVPDAAALLETIRTEIREIDASLPVLSAMTMREFRDENWLLWASRMGGRLVMVLGMLALFLAMVGLYGVRAFLVSRRTREIGVRMALGATHGDVVREMLRDGLAVTAIGVVVGLLLALAAGRVLSNLLYEVSSADPLVFAGATLFLAGTATLASYLPVRRALRIEPTAALRYE